jgi:integrase
MHWICFFWSGLKGDESPSLVLLDMSTKDTKSQAVNLSLILSQGAAFVRSIKPRHKKNGKWYVRPSINGKSIYVQFNSEEEALNLLKLLPASTTNKNRPKAFFDYYMTFIDSIQVANTAKTYWYAKKYLEPISRKSLDQIKSDDLKIVQSGTPKSQWNILMGIFSGVAKMADEEDSAYYFIVHKFNRDKNNAYISNREDVENPEAILKAIIDFQTDKLSEQRARLAFLIICFTGLRIGELLAMTEEDWANKEIKIAKTVTEQFSRSGTAAKMKTTIQGHTKGKKERMVPIEDRVRFLVKRYFALLEFDERTSIHCHRKQISEPLGRIHKALSAKGINVQKFTPKTGRHIFGTILGRAAKSMDEALKLQKMMGHAFFETTEIYITSNKATSETITSAFPALSEIKQENPPPLQEAVAKKKRGRPRKTA